MVFNIFLLSIYSVCNIMSKMLKSNARGAFILFDKMQHVWKHKNFSDNAKISGKTGWISGQYWPQIK